MVEVGAAVLHRCEQRVDEPREARDDARAERDVVSLEEVEEDGTD